jgi:hypothetical protein
MLPGHGQPGGKEIYAQDREYLSAARRLVAEATSEEQLKAALIQRFSDYWGEIMLDIQNMYLFPAAHKKPGIHKRCILRPRRRRAPAVLDG